MRHTHIIFGSILILLAGAANAGVSPAEERIGVGIGVTVGAVAGGPVGAIIGAAIGAKLGDSYHQKNEQIGTLSAQLDGKSSRVGELEGEIADLSVELSTLDSDLRRLQATSRPELISLLTAGIEMDLLFRTDEHVLSDATQGRIAELAATLATMPDVRLQLDGYADERGDADYNQALSMKRAQHIRKMLTNNGIADARIAIIAHGEIPSSDPGVDSFALQRKVSLTVFINETPSLASNPE